VPTYVVDETPLDHPAGCWRLLAGTQRRPLPGVRSVEVSVPGVPGELGVVGEEVEPITLGLTLGVYGRDARGAPGGRRALEDNLEALASVFDSSRRLLDVRWRVDELVERQAWGKVVAASEPEVFNSAAYARLSVVLRIPGAYWRDVPEEVSTWSARSPTPRRRAPTRCSPSTPGPWIIRTSSTRPRAPGSRTRARSPARNAW
jgi:hypothetical protein